MSGNIEIIIKDTDGKTIKRTISIASRGRPFSETIKAEFQYSNSRWNEPLFFMEGTSPIFNTTFRGKSSFCLIESVSGFSDDLSKIHALDSPSDYCYRGQSAVSLILPSVLQNTEYFENMDSMQQEVMAAYPHEFENIKSKMDKIALMRSHGLPTNTLDFTTNPMVALFYACKSCIGKNASLGMVLICKHGQLLNVGNFDNGCINKSPVFFRPSVYSSQISNQQTVFLVYPGGTCQSMVKQACNFNNNTLEETVYLVTNDKAERILSELSELGINDYQMNPEIEILCRNVKDKYASSSLANSSSSQDFIHEKCLDVLADAYIDKGYISLDCIIKFNSISESWFLSDTNRIVLNCGEDKEVDERIDEACNGTIKYVLCTQKPKGDKSSISLLMEKFLERLTYTIKARIHRRLEDLENRIHNLWSMEIECDRERNDLENSASTSMNYKLELGEVIRWGMEIRRIQSQVITEKDFLNVLRMHVAIEKFIPDEEDAKPNSWFAMILFDPLRISPRLIDTPTKLLIEINAFRTDNASLLKPYSLYYRGQPLQFPITASLFRDTNFIKHEKDMYAELLARLPETFNKEPSIFDQLVVMKHYEFPSRLLDLTSNPLVAMLFANLNMIESNSCSLALQAVNICFSRKENEKNILSDTVVRLCALPLVEDYELSDTFSEESNFLNEIKYRSQRYAPGYYPMQPCKEELDKAIVVHPSMNNKRVERQKGEFILSGRNNDKPELQNGEVNNFFFPRELAFLFPIPLFVMSGKNTKDILQELKQHFGIDRSYIYPEMKYKIQEIRERYSRP